MKVIVKAKRGCNPALERCIIKCKVSNVSSEYMLYKCISRVLFSISFRPVIKNLLKLLVKQIQISERSTLTFDLQVDMILINPKTVCGNTCVFAIVLCLSYANL